MALRRHTMAAGTKPPVNHHQQLVVEFNKWLEVFNDKTKAKHPTSKMNDLFPCLVKAAKELVSGKSAVTTKIGSGYKEKAKWFLDGAKVYFCVDDKVHKLPATLKALTEALKHKEMGRYARNRYFLAVFKGKPGAPAQPLSTANVSCVSKVPSSCP